MSYCVNCGVELAPSEKRCPLCGVEVKNPAAPWVEPAMTPYPSRMENLQSHIDSRYLAAFSSLLMLIPLFLCLFCDLLDGGLSWSLLVGGALGLLFLYALFPYITNKTTLPVLLSIDTVGTLLYLKLIEFVSGGQWFLRLGMPICLSAGFFLVALTGIFHMNKRMGGLVRTACVFFAAGLFLVFLELILNQYHTGVVFLLNWSIYPLIPCVILGVSALLLNRRIRLKDEFRRRFFL